MASAPTSQLNKPTLVLNRSWQPVNVTTVERALTMVCKDVAQVVDPADYQLFTWEDWTNLVPDQDEPFIQSVRMQIRVPEVIVLRKFNELPSAIVTFSRRNVFKRDKYTCQYCNQQPGTDELTIDHVTPRAQGGGSSWENCVLSCLTCNQIKADRTPEQAGMKLRNQPVRPKWKPLYAEYVKDMTSWRKFISEAYWVAELEP